MHEIQIWTRFSETDAAGHLNNTSYFIYLEEARLRFLDSMGMEVERKDWNVILASAKCDYINQGFFNRVLNVQTSVSKIGTKSFAVEHIVICNETQTLIAKGEAVLVCFDFEHQVSTEVPDWLREKLKKELIQH